MVTQNVSTIILNKRKNKTHRFSEFLNLILSKTFHLLNIVF